MLFRRDDHQVRAIMERVRAMVQRQPGHDLCISADALEIPALDLARLLDAREPLDRTLLMDVITALAYEAAVDPHWVLTGEYDGAVHREVLRLGEDRSALGKSAVRAFVEQQYRQLPRGGLFGWLTGRKTARPQRAQSARTAMSA